MTAALQSAAPIAATTLECGKVSITWTPGVNVFTVHNSTGNTPLTQSALDAATQTLVGLPRTMLAVAVAVAHDFLIRKNGITADTDLGSDGRTDVAKLGTDENIRIQVQTTGAQGPQVVISETAMTPRARRRVTRYGKQQARDSRCCVKVNFGSVTLSR